MKFKTATYIFIRQPGTTLRERVYFFTRSTLKVGGGTKFAGIAYDGIGKASNRYRRRFLMKTVIILLDSVDEGGSYVNWSFCDSKSLGIRHSLQINQYPEC